ncbi:MAG: hypothetical protein D6826_10570 [Alphaproteobacteria bacterium]|nr:MAG: hypothetical protein D6826_10570 [Alphaproteobacteria bacterium]
MPRSRVHPAPSARVFCFSVQADADPGVMPRVLELFAKRNLVPDRWVSDVTGTTRRELSIDLQVAGLTPETSAYIARCLRQICGVTTVLTSEKGWGRPAERTER